MSPAEACNLTASHADGRQRAGSVFSIGLLAMNRWLNLIALFVILLPVAAVEQALALECQPLPSREVSAVELSRFDEGLIWELISPTGGKNLIVGTMHIGDARVMAVANNAIPLIDQYTAFAMEVVLGASAMLQLQTSMFFTDGNNLESLVGAELFADTAKRIARYGVPDALLRQMKPWAVFTTLSLPPGQSNVPMDIQLMEQAQAKGLDIRGIETVAEQVDIFESISVDDQVQMLRETVCHYEIVQAELESMIKLYGTEDLAGLYRLSMRHVVDHRESFMDALLWERNGKMFARLGEDVRDGGWFIAVGALHLAGTRGLLEMFEQDGFEVRRLR